MFRINSPLQRLLAFQSRRISSHSPARYRAKLEPYLKLARIDKPVGTILLYIPCTWSILTAATYHNVPVLDTAQMLLLFGAGSFVMRGAGCTINDLWDQDYDRKVARTKTRPLASGELSTRQAVGFLALQLSVGLGILTQLNMYSIGLGASSMLLVSTYPLAKRFTNYPQLVLGLTFNWGALLGWPALVGSMSWLHVLPFYAGAVCWTLVYDTLYAHQDKKDDAVLKLKSTALTFGDTHTKSILKAFVLLGTSNLLLAGYLADLSWIYGLAVFAAGIDSNRMVTACDLSKPESAGSAFLSSQRSGWLVTAGLLAEYLFQ